MEIRRTISIRPLEPNVDLEPQSTETSDAKPVGFAQNDSLENANAGKTPLQDILTGAGQDGEQSGIQEPGSVFQQVAHDAIKQKIQLDPNETEYADHPTTAPAAGGFSGDARSRLLTGVEALKDYFSAPGIDFGSGDGTTSSSTSGSGSGGTINASDYGKNVPDGAADLINGAQNGSSDPFSNLQETLGRLSNLGNIDARGMIQGALQNLGENQGTTNPYGKELIAHQGGVGYGSGTSDDEGVKPGSGETAKKNPGLNEAVKNTYVFGGHGSNREWALKASEDDVNPNDYTTSDGTRVQTGKDGTQIFTAKDGTKTVIATDGTKTTVNPDGSTSTTKPDGNTETTPPLKDNIGQGDSDGAGGRSGKLSKAQQFIKANASLLGITTIDDLRYSKGPGNIDPAQDGETIGRDFTNVVSQQGEYGLLGQPMPDNDTGGGGSGISGDSQFAGGAGENWRGAKRSESPESMFNQATLKEHASDDSKEEETNTDAFKNIGTWRPKLESLDDKL